jgi:hypothetical protein
VKHGPLVLVPDTISNDTVEALQQLLRHARKGDIIGLGFVAMLKPTREVRGYIANTAGEAHTNATFTCGMLRALDFKLCQRLHGGSP